MVAACALGGGVLALRADDPQVHSIAAGDLAVSVRPAFNGRVEVYVPVVNWRLSSDAFDAPVALEVEARAVDRGAAARALKNPRSAPAAIDRMRRDAESALGSSVRRAAVVALLGMMAGGLVGGAVVTVVVLRRRWVLIGVLESALLGVCLIGASVANVRDLEVSRFSNPELEGHARELPGLIAFAQQLLVVGDEYQEHYERALRSVTNSTAFMADGASPDHPGEVSLVLASDLHNNLFVLDAFAGFADGDPVVLAGDFSQVGARVETQMAPRIAASGDEVIAVSGNHDSDDFMRSLAREGVTVLARSGVLGTPGDHTVVDIDGLRVAGFDDPLEGRDGDPNVLRVYGEAYEKQAKEFIAWFDTLARRPDVVIVHQHGLAERLLRHLADTGVRQPIVILTGHDHRAHVDMVGVHVLVDGGTLGAGGPFAVGEQDASFARVRFRNRRAHAVEIAAIEPLTGRAVARRIVLGEPHPTMKTIDVNTGSGGE